MLEFNVDAEEGPQQDWFWSAGWQAAYREAKEDLAEARYQDFDDVEQLIVDLQQGIASGNEQCGH